MSKGAGVLWRSTSFVIKSKRFGGMVDLRD